MNILRWLATKLGSPTSSNQNPDPVTPAIVTTSDTVRATRPELSSEEYEQLKKQLLRIPEEDNDARKWSRYPFMDARKKIIEALSTTGAATIREPKDKLALIKPLYNFNQFIDIWTTLNEARADIEEPPLDTQTDEMFAESLGYILIEVKKSRGYVTLLQDKKGYLHGYFVFDE
ncbi:MAG: hypothetical protein MR006_05755 [Arcanobacterium sp.]|nr:hypothetical protein [Arcanobacterium sp.]